MNDAELTDASARAMGWVDYPDDSLEKGQYWHFNPKKPLTGGVLAKIRYDPLMCVTDATYIAVELGIFLRSDFVRRYSELLKEGGDKHAAYRRAVVEIAANIWRLKCTS